MFCNVLTACFIWCIEVKTKLIIFLFFWWRSHWRLGLVSLDLTPGTSPSGTCSRNLTHGTPRPRPRAPGHLTPGPNPQDPGTSPPGPHPRDLTPWGPHPRAVSGRAGASTTSSSRTGSTSTSSVTSSASGRCTRTSTGRGSSSSTRRATATSTTRSVCPSARLPANRLSVHPPVCLSVRLSAC